MRIWMACLVVSAAAVTALAGGGATVARAGDYHVYSCRTPGGAVTATDGWSETTGGEHDVAEDSCATGGGLVAGLKAQDPHTATTDLATWEFNTPAGETIAGATLWRAGDTAGGSSSHTTYGLFSTEGTTAEKDAEEFGKCLANSPCSGVGDLSNPLSEENVVHAPDAPSDSTYVSLNAACETDSPPNTCPSGNGDADGLAAKVELFASDILLEQTAPPTVSGVGGALASLPQLEGWSDLSFTASDPGSGVYEVRFVVDGVVKQTSVLDENGGKCRDLGGASDGYAAFSSPTPCPTSLEKDIQFDTTTISNGTRHLVVEVLDAAGNATTVLDREINVENPYLGIACGCAEIVPRGPGNGAGASDQAVLSARWSHGRKAQLTDAYGDSHKLEGRLVDPAGRPIVGAAIEVTETPSYAGARARVLRAPKTSSKGAWSIVVPRGTPSAAFRISYRSHLGDFTPAAVKTATLKVRPAISLKISPRTVGVGQRISFRGTVLGSPIPSGGKQLVLEARSPGTGWIEFRVIRTDSRGRYRSSYRFRYAGPVAYEFRVFSEYEADFPFTQGSSKVVGVRER